MRVAWRITLGTFLLLVVLVVGVPLTRNWYVNAAVEPREARIRAIDGVVFLRRQGIGDWLAVSSDDKVAQGDVLRTAENARAFITLFDNSTVLLYPASTLRILRAEQGRFRGDKRSVILELSQGRARMGSPRARAGTAFFQLRSPQAEVHLEEGSYLGRRLARREPDRHPNRGRHRPHRRRLGGRPRRTAPARSGDRGADGGPAVRARPGRERAVQPARRQPARRLRRCTSSQTSRRKGPSPSTPGRARSRSGASAPPTPRRPSRRRSTPTCGTSRRWCSAPRSASSATPSPAAGWFGTEYPIMIRLQYRDAQGQLIPWSRG